MTHYSVSLRGKKKVIFFSTRFAKSFYSQIPNFINEDPESCVTKTAEINPCACTYWTIFSQGRHLLDIGKHCVDFAQPSFYWGCGGRVTGTASVRFARESCDPVRPKWRERGLAPNENSLSLEDCTPWVSDPCHRCFGKAVCPQEGFTLQQFWQDWCLWEWRSSQRTVSCGRDPTAGQRKNSSPWTNRSQVTNWPKPPCPNLLHYQWEGLRGKKLL